MSMLCVANLNPYIFDNRRKTFTFCAMHTIGKITGLLYCVSMGTRIHIREQEIW